MLTQADALVSYRTYPHVDMAATGALAAYLLQRRWDRGRREVLRVHRLPFLIPLNAMCTGVEPARSIYQKLVELDLEHGSMLSFCMGFPAADIAECGPVLWGYGPTEAVAQAATDALDACNREYRMSRGRRPTLLVYRVICSDEDALNWCEEDIGNLRVALNALVRVFRI